MPTTQGAPTSQSKTPDGEVASRGETAEFKLHVNLVVVRVVVRDAKGKPVANLTKEDFQLFDNRKLQTIWSFATETPTSRALTTQAVSTQGISEGSMKVVELPQRFVAMYFDDLHASDAELMESREAGKKLVTAMGASDRLAVFASSGG